MKKIDVLGIGNPLVDILISVDEKEVKELGLAKGIMHLVDAPRQKRVLDAFRERSWTTELGGSAMNAVRILAALNAKTAFSGMIGSDVFGEQIRNRMKEVGIVARLGESDETTGTCAILITPDGERTMNTCLGASSLFSESLLPLEDIKKSKYLHFCGYEWSTPNQTTAITRAISLAKENGVKVSFDLGDAFLVRANKEEFRRVVSEDADVVFANEEEAKMLYESVEAAGMEISSSGATAVIKLGRKGAMVYKDGKSTSVHPVKTSVIDTTAAGDMFAGGFLFGLVNDKPLAECGKMAAILASDVISRVGATVANEAITEVRGFVKNDE